jgi:hypothetical protein
MLGMKALHVEVSEPAVPQYWVAMFSEGKTGVDTSRHIRWGVGVRVLLMWEPVKSIVGRF